MSGDEEEEDHEEDDQHEEDLDHQPPVGGYAVEVLEQRPLGPLHVCQRVVHVLVDPATSSFVHRLERERGEEGTSKRERGREEGGGGDLMASSPCWETMVASCVKMLLSS